MFRPSSYTALKDCCILVVDDDPASLEIARIILYRHGAMVSTAWNGAEGLRQARVVQPNFIVSDISMPIMDGWKFVAEIKNDTKLAHIPVVALTAHAMVGDRDRVIGAGFHSYMTKPLTPMTFVRDLLRVLADVPALAHRLPREEILS